MSSSEQTDQAELTRQADRLMLRHLSVGWWALGFYLLLGVVLEGFHATKAGLYLDVGNETRRLLFRLAHAHGTLLAIVNILYALTIRAVPPFGGAASPLASGSLIVALLLMPAGFLLGGIWAQGGDPGLGAVLIPAGGLALVLGVSVVALGVRKGA
jgi:hypothetical protein